MGWYADTSWNLTFHDDQAVLDCIVDLRLLEGFDADDLTFESLPWVLARSCNEDGDGHWVDDTHLAGWGGGKAYEHGDEPLFEERVVLNDDGTEHHRYRLNYGGLGIYDVLAKYATGTVDWKSEDDYYWRIRFAGGTWTKYVGEVVYPEDPEHLAR